MKTKKIVLWGVLGLVLALPALAIIGPYLNLLTSMTVGVSTVPGNGDINPYGVAIVPKTIGKLVRNNVLVSNFNNGANLQGTGTTIVQIWPNGVRTLFAKLNPTDYQINPQRIGLTTALVVLSNGWVIVGSLPTQDGTSSTATDGNIFILNSNGKVVKILSGDLIHGPWDAAALDGGNRATLFFTMVLDGTVAASPNIVNKGTIVRIVLTTPLDNGSNSPTEQSRTVIASGFAQRTDPAALVIGPTGLAPFAITIIAPPAVGAPPLVQDLYVADTLMNRIMVIHNSATRTTSAGTGDLVFQGGALNQPLGLALTPFATLLATNGGDGNIVEVSFGGNQLSHRTLNANGAGTLFGLAVRPFTRLRSGLLAKDPAGLFAGKGVYFVDDGANTLRLLH